MLADCMCVRGRKRENEGRNWCCNEKKKKGHKAGLPVLPAEAGPGIRTEPDPGPPTGTHLHPPKYNPQTLTFILFPLLSCVEISLKSVRQPPLKLRLAKLN